MVVFDDPVRVSSPALQAVLMALEVRDAMGALTATRSRWARHWLWHRHRHGFATLGRSVSRGGLITPPWTVSNVASRLCDEAKPGQILISPQVLTKVETP